MEDLSNEVQALFNSIINDSRVIQDMLRQNFRTRESYYETLTHDLDERLTNMMKSSLSDKQMKEFFKLSRKSSQKKWDFIYQNIPDFDAKESEVFDQLYQAYVRHPRKK